MKKIPTLFEREFKDHKVVKKTIARILTIIHERELQGSAM